MPGFSARSQLGRGKSLLPVSYSCLQKLSGKLAFGIGARGTPADDLVGPYSYYFPVLGLGVDKGVRPAPGAPPPTSLASWILDEVVKEGPFSGLLVAQFCPYSYSAKVPPQPSSRRKKHSRAAFGTRRGLVWGGVKRASSWSWGPQKSTVPAGRRQREVLGGELDLEPKVCLGQEVPPKPPAGAGPGPGSASPGLAGAGREVAAPGSGGRVRGNHSRHLVLIPCHTLTLLVNSLLLLWSSRVSLLPVHFSIWLGYGSGPSTLTPRV